jgi:hypothetical protein
MSDVETKPDAASLEIPKLDIASYGDQETFLAMLELVVNTLVTVVNALVQAELARSPLPAPKIINVRDWSDGPRGPDL